MGQPLGLGAARVGLDGYAAGGGVDSRGFEELAEPALEAAGDGLRVIGEVELSAFAQNP
jgi:hypothetical protein